MRLCLETVAVALSMFSAIPMPSVLWNERNMRYALCAFPLVGVIIALLWWGAVVLCELLGLPVMLRAAILCLIPVFVTGGIHLDGYADTCDALASHASPERRQEILKDPRCGAFAVIWLCSYFVGYFALCGAFIPEKKALLCIGLSFILSRALSGLCVVSLSGAKNTGLAHGFAVAAEKRTVQILLGALTVFLCAALFITDGLISICMILTAGGSLLCCVHTARTKFGGWSGDLAGWFLQKTEFWMLASIVFASYVKPLL
ncbi:MAG: adenosylcobinamide-GDP ribazoletransferase [Eubacteriales bacterium]|nr:adenosylcobinamide-GDP ribazoletransferase [Eubacteriales bacterium]